VKEKKNLYFLSKVNQKRTIFISNTYANTNSLEDDIKNIYYALESFYFDDDLSDVYSLDAGGWNNVQINSKHGTIAFKVLTKGIHTGFINLNYDSSIKQGVFKNPFESKNTDYPIGKRGDFEEHKFILEFYPCKASNPDKFIIGFEHRDAFYQYLTENLN